MNAASRESKTIATAWRDEFRRRIDDIESGNVRLVDGEESEGRVRALLAELHR